MKPLQQTGNNVMIFAEYGASDFSLEAYDLSDVRFYCNNAPGDKGLIRTSLNHNQWHHIVMSIDGTMQRLFVDGQLVDEDQWSEPINDGGEFHIGGRDISTTYTAAQYDDMAIYSRALDPEEIADMYRTGQRTGEVLLRPIPGQEGTTTITVTVEDAGDDNLLNTTGDNLTFSRTFDVTIGDSNQLPTIEFTGQNLAQRGETLESLESRVVSLNHDGTILAIGEDGSHNRNNRVTIYRWADGGWQPMGSPIHGEASGDHFGSSVRLSADGQTVATGAPGNDGNGTDAAHARVHRYDGNG